MSNLDLEKRYVKVFVFEEEELINIFKESIHVDSRLTLNDIAKARQELRQKLSRTAYAYKDNVTLVAIGDELGHPLLLKSKQKTA